MTAERLEITSPEELPENSAPRLPEGFLGQLKRDWAEEGCQIPGFEDDLLEKLQWKIEHSQLDDSEIFGLLDGLRALLDAKAIRETVWEQAVAVLEPLYSDDENESLDF